jgi:FMN phosphatase YigB (HAD superfamily)
VIKAVFVDWYKTLSTSLFWQYCREARLSSADSSAVERHVFGQPELVRAWMLGTIGAEDVCCLAAEALCLRPEDVVADLQRSCQAMELDAPAAIDTVRLLRQRGIKVVLATDNMDTFERWTVPALRLDQHFDAILSSSTCHALKADLANGQSPFFGPWLAKNGISPTEATLVDDSRCPAAEVTGMTVRVVDNPANLVRILTRAVRSGQ